MTATEPRPALTGAPPDAPTPPSPPRPTARSGRSPIALGRWATPVTAAGMLGGAFVVAAGAVLVFWDGPLHRAIPAIVGLGTVFGALNALSAVGIILIYRLARVINFAQAGFGVGALMLYLLLTSGWGWNWWISAFLALAGAAAAGLVVEVFIIRRFARSPRLVLTVVTIALAQTLAGVTLVLPWLFGFRPEPDDPSGIAALPSTPPTTPFDRFSFSWFPIRFTGGHIAAVVVTLAVMAALAAFFRYSTTGVAVRAQAENASRAELLGINVHNVSTIVWVMAAVLAGAAGILGGMVSATTVAQAAGQSGQAAGGLAAAVGATSLVRALAAAVLARMQNIPVAVAAAVAIAWFEQGMFWATARTDYVDVALLVTIVVALLVQRARSRRFDEAEVASWAATEEIRGIPAELARMPEVRAGVRRALWLGAIVVVAYPWVMSPSQTNLGGVYAMYGIVGISLVILTGWAGQISLGQFAFVAVGAAIGGLATSSWGLPFPIGLAVGSVAAGAVAVVVGLPALRIKGLFLAVTTLALSVATATWFLGQGWIPGDVGRPVFLGFDANTDERTYYYITVVGLAVAVFLAQGLRRSRTGRILIAMRDNERAAQAFGINLVRVRLTAFAISGILAGFAGALFAHHQSAVSPESFGPEQSIQMFLMAVIGGLGSVYAVLVGAIYLGTATIVIDNAAGQLLASSFGVLAILLFFPTGLGSVVFRARDAWLRRVAYRNRIWVPALMGDRLKQGEEARVPIAARLPEAGEVPERYRLVSRIGEQGRSQLTKLWRY